MMKTPTFHPVGIGVPFLLLFASVALAPKPLEMLTGRGGSDSRARAALWCLRCPGTRDPSLS